MTRTRRRDDDVTLEESTISLSSAKAKLRRAALHIDEANKAFQAVMNAGLYSSVIESDGNGRRRIKVTSVLEPPPIFALAVGDAAACLRSSLDHIAFALAEKPLSPKEEKNLQFPISSSVEEFLAATKRGRLNRVPQAAISLAEKFQPYHGGENELLSHIQTLNNWDKHRSIPISYTKIKRTQIEVLRGAPYVSEITEVAGPLEVDAILSTYKIQDGIGDNEVQVKCRVVVVPAFGPGMPQILQSVSICTMLTNAAVFIGNQVVHAFEALPIHT